MAFYHVSGPALTESFQKVTSTAIAVGSALGFHAIGANAGRVAQARDISLRIAGIAIKKIASTDSDYADATNIPLIVPSEDDVFSASVSGTATQANVGKQYDLTQTDAGTAQAVNLSGTSRKVVTVVGFVSSSEVLVKFNGNYAFANKDN